MLLHIRKQERQLLLRTDVLFIWRGTQYKQLENYQNWVNCCKENMQKCFSPKLALTSQKNSTKTIQFSIVKKQNRTTHELQT